MTSHRLLGIGCIGGRGRSGVGRTMSPKWRIKRTCRVFFVPSRQEVLRTWAKAVVTVGLEREGPI